MIHENNGQIGGTKSNKKPKPTKTSSHTSGITAVSKSAAPIVLKQSAKGTSSRIESIVRETVRNSKGNNERQLVFTVNKKKIPISLKSLSLTTLIHGAPKLKPIHNIVEEAGRGKGVGILAYWVSMHINSVVDLYKEIVTCTLAGFARNLYSLTDDAAFKASLNAVGVNAFALTLNPARNEAFFNERLHIMFLGSETGDKRTSTAWYQFMAKDNWTYLDPNSELLYYNLFLNSSPREYIEWGSSSAADAHIPSSQFYGAKIDVCYLCGRKISVNDKPPPEGEHVVHVLAWAMGGGSRVITKRILFQGISAGHLFACKCCNQIKKQMPILNIKRNSPNAGDLYVDDGAISLLLTAIWNERKSKNWNCIDQTFVHINNKYVDDRAGFMRERTDEVKTVATDVLSKLNKHIDTLAGDKHKGRASTIYELFLGNLFARFISLGNMAYIHDIPTAVRVGGGNRNGNGPTMHFHKVPFKSRSHKSHKKHHSKHKKGKILPSMDDIFFETTEKALKFGIESHLHKLVDLDAIDRIDMKEATKEDVIIYEKETSQPLVNTTEIEVDTTIKQLKKLVDRLQHLYEFLGISDHVETSIKSISEHSSVRVDTGRTTRKKRRHNRKHSKRHHQSVSEKSASERHQERHQSASEKSASASASASERSHSHRSNPFAALASLSDSLSASASDKSLQHANHSKTANTENQDHVVSELPKKPFLSRHSIRHRPTRHSIGLGQSVRVQG